MLREEEEEEEALFFVISTGSYCTFDFSVDQTYLPAVIFVELLGDNR